MSLIPATESHVVAVAIHDKSIVAFLLDLYERAWERAMPFTVADDTASKTVAAEVRAMTLRMLVEGHSDNASAKRVGVSTRTYAGYVASLKAEYNVDTRFQLGYAIGQQEIRDREPSDQEEDVVAAVDRPDPSESSPES